MEPIVNAAEEVVLELTTTPLLIVMVAITIAEPFQPLAARSAARLKGVL
jgi:hypothetical protein